MAVVEMLECPSTAARVVKGTPALTAATPKLWRIPWGQAWGPRISAVRMISLIWREAVERDMGHKCWRWVAVRACSDLRRWTSSRLRMSSRGTGTSRQLTVSRFILQMCNSACSRSTWTARSASASEIRQPLSSRVSAKVWTSGRRARRAVMRNLRRSSAVRYFRPRWLTRLIVGFDLVDFVNEVNQFENRVSIDKYETEHMF